MKKFEYKLTADQTAYIKDLELQIDYLVGWNGSGVHWKKNYYMREDFIMEHLDSEDTPPEIKDKIGRLRDMIEMIREGRRPDQHYLTEDHLKHKDRPILVNDRMTGESYFI